MSLTGTDRLQYQGKAEMPIPEIEEFAKILIERVRDPAIQSNYNRLAPSAKGPVAERWRKAAAEDKPALFAKEVIPDIVDSCLFYLLNAIDEGVLNVSFQTASDKMIDLTVDGRGELGGCYMDSQGWRAAYSKERVVDDFPD